MVKKNMRKFLSLALSSALIFSLIGCGSESENSSETNTTSSAIETTSSSEETSIYWFSDVTGWGPSGWANGVTSSPLLDAIKDNTGVTFEIEQPPTDADTKLALMIASKDLPDLISITNSDMINELIASGEIYTMQEFLETYDPESHLLTDFPDDVKQAMINKWGDWYSFPSHMDSADHRETYTMSCDIFEDNVTKGMNAAIMFNENIMNELGLTQEDVQTEEGFLKACELVKNANLTVDGQSVIPVMMHADNWINNSVDGALSSSFGVIEVDGDGNYQHREINPGYKEVLSFVNKLVRNEYLDINSLTLDENAMLSYVESGRVFCWIGNPAQTSELHSVPFVSYGPILSDTGAVPCLGVNQMAGTGWIQTFVSKNCKNPEALAKAISFATSDEGLWLNYYGVENVDYTLQDDGTYVRTSDGQTTYETQYNSNIWLWPFNDTDFFWHTTPGPEEGSEDYSFGKITTAIGRYETTYIYDSGLLSFVDSNVIEPSSDLGIASSQIENYLESQKATIVSASSEEEFEQEYQNMIDTLNGYNVTAVDEELNKTLQSNYQLYGETITDPNASVYGN